MFLIKIAIFVSFFVSLYQQVIAIRCYACSIGEQDLDQSCVDSLTTDMIISCSMRYCRTIRQDYLDPKGKVASIYRGCDDNPQPKNEVVEDSTYKTYYSACQTDLCNDGSGKGSGVITGSLGDKTMLLVPGIGTSDSNLPRTSFLLIGIGTIIHMIFLMQ